MHFSCKYIASALEESQRYRQNVLLRKHFSKSKDETTIRTTENLVLESSVK